MEIFNGKAIYQPTGKAAEYAKWACNFFVGCSNICEYCYCKKGILASAMGQDKPQLKKCFKDETHAIEVFKKELKQNLSELQQHGIFFSFTTDPMLPETQQLTYMACGIALHQYQIPVTILTKRADWVDGFLEFMENSNSDNKSREWRKNLAVGFTLTGHDELEPHASTNSERIEAMKKLHDAGFKTIASIEPIIDFMSSAKMIKAIQRFCNLIKIGLMSGQSYDYQELFNFFDYITLGFCNEIPIYWKDSLLKAVGINREDLPKNCVTRDYNIFTNNTNEEFVNIKEFFKELGAVDVDIEH